MLPNDDLMNDQQNEYYCGGSMEHLCVYVFLQRVNAPDVAWLLEVGSWKFFDVRLRLHSESKFKWPNGTKKIEDDFNFNF